jgi:hypothetical protein
MPKTAADSYTIAEHTHRLAAWAASRASSVKGQRFTVKRGFCALEEAEVDSSFNLSCLPVVADEFDELHSKKCNQIIRLFSSKNQKIYFGVAAKLINCYLKVRFVNESLVERAQVNYIHPPIDRLLLSGLRKKYTEDSFWKECAPNGWSKLNENEYYAIIRSLRATVGSAPLWSIEVLWRGHR